MSRIDINVPTINDAASDFETLMNLDQKIREACKHSIGVTGLYFNFSDCRFLRPNGVAYLGAISTYLKEVMGYKVFYKIKTMDKRILKMLIDDGFIQKNFTSHRDSKKPISADFIKFDHFKGNLNEDLSLSQKIRNYINDDWLKNDWIHLEDNLKRDISAKMYEIFANALEHSKSNIGCFACGQKYEQTSEFVLSVVDLGLGIPGSVRKFIGTDISDQEAIMWAFKNNNTTRPNGVGGLGLDLISDFLNLNDGELSVYSNSVSYKIKNKDIKVISLDSLFSGTIVNIRIRIDEKNLYLYKHGAKK